MTGLFLVCLAFLSGSIPFGLILTWAFAGRDVRTVGSGNIGAANVARAAGTPVGFAVAALDVIKGIVPLLLGRHLGLEPGALAVVALAAVLGHDFSIFLRFRGGKGVATSIGVAAVLAPVAGTLAAVTWVVVVFAARFTSLASLSSLALLPLYMGLTGAPPAYVFLASSLFMLATVKHWDNIIRLAAGRERRFREPRDDGA